MEDQVSDDVEDQVSDDVEDQVSDDVGDQPDWSEDLTCAINDTALTCADDNDEYTDKVLNILNVFKIKYIYIILLIIQHSWYIGRAI